MEKEKGKKRKKRAKQNVTLLGTEDLIEIEVDNPCT